MTIRPLVSIALPAFNSARTIRAAVESILWQTYDNWELLVLDDGSSDATGSMVTELRDPRIRVLSDGLNRGLAVRLNQAMDLARGPLFARMDADDVAYPERMDKQVRFLEAHPEVDLLATRALAFRSDGTIRGVLPFRQSHAEICRRPWATFPLPHPTWMGRLAWFRAYRYRIPEVRRAEDHDLLLRAYPKSRFACLPEVLLGYRQDAFTLDRQLKARFHLAGAHLRSHLRDGHVGYAVLGVSLQAVKAVADTLASVPGLSSLYFNRVGGAVTDAEKTEWENIWRQVERWTSNASPASAAG